jgi:putative membrane protein
MGSNSGQPAAWKSLHPASVAVNLLPRAWRTLRTSWLFIVAILYGSASVGESLFNLWLIVMFLGFPVVDAVIHFLTLRYRIIDGRLQIRTGLFNRQLRDIAPDRIQNIERIQNLFQKAANLVEVRIETASGSDTEGLLSALDETQADLLMEQLNTLRGVQPREQTEEYPIIASNDLSDLLWYSATATRFGMAAVFFGFCFEALQFIEPDQVEELGGVLGFIGGFAVLVAAIVGAWLLDLLTTILRHYKNTLFDTGRSLISEEGLLTKRRLELPIAKVQVVSTRRPLLRRLMDFGTVHIETASGQMGGDGTLLSKAIIPVVKTADLHEICTRAIPAFTSRFDEITWKPPHPKAFHRAAIRSSIRVMLLVAIATALAGGIGLLALLILPVSLGLVWLDHAYQGWYISDNVVLTRRGFLDRRVHLVARSKLQSLDVHQGPIMRRWGLGRLALHVAGNTIVLPDLSLSEATTLQRQLIRRLALEAGGLDRLQNHSLRGEPEDPGTTSLESHLDPGDPFHSPQG